METNECAMPQTRTFQHTRARPKKPLCEIARIAPLQREATDDAKACSAKPRAPATSTRKHANEKLTEQRK